MYKSTIIEEFLKKDVETEDTLKKKKESRINDIISVIRSDNTIKNGTAILWWVFSLIMYGSIYYMDSLMQLMRGYGFVALLFCILFPVYFSLLFAGLLFPILYFGYKDNLKKTLCGIKNLFFELSEKPYEFRIEMESVGKAKIVIEANQIQNNTLVVKDKSQHLTAYIDLKSSREDIVSSVVSLVKLAEEKFKSI
jgi:hypothetical protein